MKTDSDSGRVLGRSEAATGVRSVCGTGRADVTAGGPAAGGSVSRLNTEAGVMSVPDAKASLAKGRGTDGLPGDAAGGETSLGVCDREELWTLGEAARQEALFVRSSSSSQD